MKKTIYILIGLCCLSSLVFASTCSDSDLNKDGKVNFGDLTIFAAAYGTQTNDTLYNSAADTNLDGSINFADLTNFAGYYGDDCYIE